MAVPTPTDIVNGSLRPGLYALSSPGKRLALLRLGGTPEPTTGAVQTEARRPRAPPPRPGAGGRSPSPREPQRAATPRAESASQTPLAAGPAPRPAPAVSALAAWPRGAVRAAQRRQPDSAPPARAAQGPNSPGGGSPPPPHRVALSLPPPPLPPSHSPVLPATGTPRSAAPGEPAASPAARQGGAAAQPSGVSTPPELRLGEAAAELLALASPTLRTRRQQQQQSEAAPIGRCLPPVPPPLAYLATSDIQAAWQRQEDLSKRRRREAELRSRRRGRRWSEERRPQQAASPLRGAPPEEVVLLEAPASARGRQRRAQAVQYDSHGQQQQQQSEAATALPLTLSFTEYKLLAGAFAAADRNADGKLTWRELARLCRGAGLPTVDLVTFKRFAGEERRGAVDFCDVIRCLKPTLPRAAVERDCALHAERREAEQRAARPGPHLLPAAEREVISDLWELCGAGRRGTAGPAELRRIAPLAETLVTDEELRRFVAELDNDRDGRLDFPEFCALMAADSSPFAAMQRSAPLEMP